MKKNCSCGQGMDVTMRTIVHARKIHILHVPVYTCGSCQYSELLPNVKDEVVFIMRRLVQKGMVEEQTVAFDHMHEMASVIKECLEYKEDNHLALFERLSTERVNQLLDLYLVAKTCKDTDWMNDIERRLHQLTGFKVAEHQAKIS
ncbi:hypothetical protein NQ117_18470 [Paenibacillus sp. SC116]|uniref:hypothetical protein n=1 Tax=Paenibacillus sp. SC116 TaxID=2968986 RepID=UPI00215A59FC|nr:hypothetical protein [Paenibacillus sp. SC116]MCR8845673.1 hypothetical protein [Paenibacillus sp. SC116]